MKYYHIQLYYTPKGNLQENLLVPLFFNRKKTLDFLKKYYEKTKPTVIKIKIRGLVFKPKN